MFLPVGALLYVIALFSGLLTLPFRMSTFCFLCKCNIIIDYNVFHYLGPAKGAERDASEGDTTEETASITSSHLSDPDSFNEEGKIVLVYFKFVIKLSVKTTISFHENVYPTVQVLLSLFMMQITKMLNKNRKQQHMSFRNQCDTWKT